MTQRTEFTDSELDKIYHQIFDLLAPLPGNEALVLSKMAFSLVLEITTLRRKA